MRFNIKFQFKIFLHKSCFNKLYCKYVKSVLIGVDTEGRFIDEKKNSQINFTIDPYQSQPFFDIDLKITNEIFSLGIIIHFVLVFISQLKRGNDV